jgi:hypothetical protein
MKKWLAGIAGSIITAVAIWWLTHPGGPLNREPSPKGPDNSVHKTFQDATATQTKIIVTRISGRVLNQDNNQPLANVDVGYFRITKDPTEYSHDIRSHLATTAPDGSFEADCSTIEAENFPLRLTLKDSSWGNATVELNEYVSRGATKTGINLYAQDSLYRKLRR